MSLKKIMLVSGKFKRVCETVEKTSKWLGDHQWYRMLKWSKKMHSSGTDRPCKERILKEKVETASMAILLQ